MSKRRKPAPLREPLLSPDNDWLAAARELVENPDSPRSLRLASAFNAAIRPRLAAVQQLVEALALQVEHPSDHADAAVRAAIVHWEAATDSRLNETLLQKLREDAITLLEDRRNQPPALESIVAGCDTTDTGYDLGLHMQGLRGTWHRFLASIAMGSLFGPSPAQVACVAEVRRQFESLLGRSMSTEERGELERHAMAHASRLQRER